MGENILTMKSKNAVMLKPKNCLMRKKSLDLRLMRSNLDKTEVAVSDKASRPIHEASVISN